MARRTNMTSSKNIRENVYRNMDSDPVDPFILSPEFGSELCQEARFDKKSLKIGAGSVYFALGSGSLFLCLLYKPLKRDRREHCGGVRGDAAPPAQYRHIRRRRRQTKKFSESQVSHFWDRTQDPQY